MNTAPVSQFNKKKFTESGQCARETLGNRPQFIEHTQHILWDLTAENGLCSVFPAACSYKGLVTQQIAGS